MTNYKVPANFQRAALAPKYPICVGQLLILAELLRPPKWPDTANLGRSMKFGTNILLNIPNDLRSGHT